MASITLAQARRIALAAQGFNDPRPTGPVNSRHFRRVMDRMTVLQLDSVNVLCRSHYLPMLARLGPYDRDKLNRYIYHSGEHFEYLSHEASITSQQHQPLLRHRARSLRAVRWVQRVEREAPGYVEAVLEEVSDRGPVSVKDLSDPGGRTGPWWGLSKGKLALECLYVTGRLSIRERTPMFVTIYDRPERVLAPEVLARPEPDEADAAKQLLLLGARSHGIGTATDIADYFRLKMPVARPLLAELVESGQLDKVEVEGWKEPAYLHPEAKRPRAVRAKALLTPFDPIVWFRPRALRLFDFHYRIEIYVPEPKRVHGYYVLPFLLDEELVGRVDLKADRKAGLLRVRGCYTEPGVDEVRVASELSGSLREMADWLGLDDVAVDKRGDLAPALVKACRRS
ncbi:MAG: winged helix-turn-helix domain-containing protein [Acidimicrobiales bacterium]